MSLLLTGSQTIGPYLHIGTDWLNTPDLTASDTEGERITIEGRMLDGDGKPVADGLLEIWQADAQGRLAHPETAGKVAGVSASGFRGWGRVPTGEDGSFRFTTIKPGRLPAPDGTMQAAHIAVTVFGRGLTRHLFTRIYFPDTEGHAKDFVLGLVPVGRRATLIARAVPERASAYVWNLVLQADAGNDDETVFFDF